MSGIYGLKPRFVRALKPAEDVLVRRSVSPDALTIASVGISFAAGAAIAAGGLLGRPALWLAVPPLVLFRLALNALDGSVARRMRRTRPFGVALNEVGDRLGDAATVGAAGLATGHHRLALGAIACAFLASLTGVLALAITGCRDCGGPVGKADRAALLALGAVAGAVVGSALPFIVVLWAILTGSLATAVIRLRRLDRALASKPLPELLQMQMIEPPPAGVLDEESLDVLAR